MLKQKDLEAVRPDLRPALHRIDAAMTEVREACDAAQKLLLEDELDWGFAVVCMLPAIEKDQLVAGRFGSMTAAASFDLLEYICSGMAEMAEANRDTESAIRLRVAQKSIGTTFTLPFPVLKSVVQMMANQEKEQKQLTLDEFVASLGIKLSKE